MNSFERFDCILRGEKPDKMPFYYPAIACSVASELMGRTVYTGTDSLLFNEEKSWLSGENAHREFVEAMHENNIALYRKLRADVVIETWRSKERPSKLLDENTLLFERGDGTHIIKRFFPENQSYGVVEDTTRPVDIDTLIKTLEERMTNHRERSYSELSQTYADALAFKKKAEPYFPVIVSSLGIGAPMYDPVWLEALVLEPDFMREYFMFVAKSVTSHITFIKEKGYRFINGGIDLAMQNGPIYSPSTFKNVLYDGLKILNDACTEADIVYCYRTDGNIWLLFDIMFLEIGFRAYGEVDRLADMSVGKIRKRAKDLIILGNVSSATLCTGSEEEVRREVRDTLAESGGVNYIAGPSNAIVADTSVKNIYAMIEEIEKFKP